MKHLVWTRQAMSEMQSYLAHPSFPSRARVALHSAIKLMRDHYPSIDPLADSRFPGIYASIADDRPGCFLFVLFAELGEDLLILHISEEASFRFDTEIVPHPPDATWSLSLKRLKGHQS